MIRKMMFLIVIVLKCTIIIAQDKSDCFNITNLDILSVPDSSILSNLHERNQQFYDKSINCKAPDFKVTTIDGDTIELCKLKGKIVVINFWFIECKACIIEVPDINKLVGEYKSENVVFISMARNSKNEIISDFNSKHKLDSEIVPSCIDIAFSYCVIGWPTTFILNEKGKLAKAFMGNGATSKSDTTSYYDRMKSIIDSLL